MVKKYQVLYNEKDLIKAKDEYGNYKVFMNDKQVGLIHHFLNGFSVEIIGAKKYPYLFSYKEDTIKNCLYRITQLYSMCEQNMFTDYIQKFIVD